MADLEKKMEQLSTAPAPTQTRVSQVKLAMETARASTTVPAFLAIDNAVGEVGREFSRDGAAQYQAKVDVLRKMQDLYEYLVAVDDGQSATELMGELKGEIKSIFEADDDRFSSMSMLFGQQKSAQGACCVCCMCF